MEIYNALDLKSGKKTRSNRLWNISQPLQFLSVDEKDADWASWNMDWLEWNGLKQLRKNSRKLMKNYKLAQGIIDKGDYIQEDNNEMKDVVAQLAEDSEMASLELKFYPIIPNVVNTLTAEFAKRNKRVTFRAVDEFTHNEIISSKKEEIEDVLVKWAESRLMEEMLQQGADPEDPEMQKMMQEKMSPENLKTLPEIQDFYTKDFEVLAEKWASKQYIIDEERFRMDELEERAFRDKLITDREFWHMHMMDDDYIVELWNPVLTFYHKSPDARYISQANYVGKVEMMTAADIIDKYGWKMNEDQLLGLQQSYPVSAAGYALGGQQNDGSYYDATKSYEWNTNSPSLEMRQYLSVNSQNVQNSNDVVEWVLGESEDYTSNTQMLRVTTAYWKSQRRIGHLTKVSDGGKVTSEIISEEYKITDKPVYNTSLIKNKTAQNLLFGEHIEWVWINHTWGGIKIGPNQPTFIGIENNTGINPIYLGINQNQIKPLKFQFKGDNTQYGCKLPVEGRIFSDRNTKSSSLVDSMKPFQIGYNIVNNQISDILIDEIGTVVMLDQNALPKHSLGEDWGKGNLAKAYVAMKDFSMLPLDGSITNTESPLNGQHFQQLDLSQTQRLMSRIQLAQFFKQQAYEQVGVNPQRMGQQLGGSSTATEVEQTQVGSYAQTEMHFVEHCDHLMPRVHEMRTDLAQWYHSTKPSIRLQHMTSLDERVNFEMNGEELLLKDINVYCTTKANHRKMLEQMQQLAANNNTTGASIYDLGRIMQADSMGTLNSALKSVEMKNDKIKQDEQAQQQQMQQQQLEMVEKEKQMQIDHDASEAEKDRRKDVLVAEIKASGFGAMQDINENKQSDFIDNMEKIQRTESYQDTADIQRTKVDQNRSQHTDKMGIKREELALKREQNATQLAVAKENKNKYDVPKNTGKKDKKKS